MTAPSPADPLGYDVAVLDDLDPTGRSATGLELVDASVLNRLQCDELEVIDAPTGRVPFGVDTRKWIGEPLTNPRGKIPLIDAALQGDPRIAKVDRIDVRRIVGTALSDASMATLAIDLTYTTIDGQTVSRVVGVSEVTVEFLAGGG